MTQAQVVTCTQEIERAAILKDWSSESRGTSMLDGFVESRRGSGTKARFQSDSPLNLHRHCSSGTCPPFHPWRPSVNICAICVTKRICGQFVAIRVQEKEIIRSIRVIRGSNSLLGQKGAFCPTLLSLFNIAE